MCLQSILSDEQRDKVLKKMADPVVCWKVVNEWSGELYPLHQEIQNTSYHTGVNIIRQCIQMYGKYYDGTSIAAGAHFFRHRADAKVVAHYCNDSRRVIRCLIAKKDIDVVGYSSMGTYYYKRPDALTIVAHRATFAKTIRKVS